MLVRPLLAVLAAVASLLAVPFLAPPAPAEQSGSEYRRVAAAAVAVGDEHSCVLTVVGRVRCWGEGADGRLGYGNTLRIGDDEVPAAAGDVSLGGRATAIAAGSRHTCALLTTGRVRCWGANDRGQLGLGNVSPVGGASEPADVEPVVLGRRATAISAGGDHTCALLDNRRVRCWGRGDLGQLGYGDTDDVGDDETVTSVGFVPGTGNVRSVSVGEEHTCVVRMSRAVRCWGEAFAGRLGYGDEIDRGDDETPAAAGDVPLGGPALAVSAGWLHTCALLTGWRVRCFGRGLHGRLGYGDGLDIGDDELPASAGNVRMQAEAAAVAAGGEHTCAVTRVGYLRCWGRSVYGQLGYGDQDSIGDDEEPVQNVPVIDRVVSVDAGDDHTCAVLRGGFVRCWGRGQYGRLGLDGTEDQGDNEPAHTEGRVDVGALALVRGAVGLAVRAVPRRDRSAPYRITVAGRLRGPWTADPATCHGRVVAEARRPSGALLARRSVPVAPTCRVRAVLVVTAGEVPPGWTALRVRVRFPGTADLRRAATNRVVRVLR